MKLTRSILVVLLGISLSSPSAFACDKSSSGILGWVHHVIHHDDDADNDSHKHDDDKDSHPHHDSDDDRDGGHHHSGSGSGSGGTTTPPLPKTS
jgi:hypothetical protein